MGEDKTLYRMNRLMRITEIDAFTAQKNAGSKAAYFGLLDDFARNASPIADSLTTPTNGKELDAFLKGIYNLQKLLLPIGASSLLWEAEKLAEFARSDDEAILANNPGIKPADKPLVMAKRIKILVAKIKTLCTRLGEARVDPSAGATVPMDSSDTVILAMAQGVEADERPKAALDPEQFEKLCGYVESFETDEALSLLRVLMINSYNNTVNTLLASLHDDLMHFDYDGAATLAKQLIEHTRIAKSAAEKATKKKILAIDDMPDVLNSVKSVLKEKYAVYGVTNHMAALKFLTTNSPDLILLDIEMPDMDGFTLLGIIRKIKAYENTPAVFLTGSVTVENIVKSRQAGGNDFLKKPIDANVLLAKIGSHLE